MILKFASETSLVVESAASATRTLTVAEMSLGTAQVYDPVLGVEAAIVIAVAKLSFEYSSLTYNTGSYTDRKSTRLNSSHGYISYAVFCLKKKKKKNMIFPEYRT